MAKNNFTLTLDTLAPTASKILFSSECTNTLEDKVVTVEQSGAVTAKVWFGLTANDEANKSKEEGSKYAAAQWQSVGTGSSISYPVTLTEGNGTYRAYIVLRDDVANESEVLVSENTIQYDTVMPTATLVLSDIDSGSTTITNDTSVKYELSFSDGVGSGVTKIEIYGDYITTQVLTIVEGSDNVRTGELSFVGAPDGTITAKLKVTDAAGNVAEEAATANILLDTVAETPILSLIGKDSKTLNKDTYINYSTITAELTSNDTDIVAYQIWEGTEEPTSWVAVEDGDITGNRFKVTKEFTFKSSGSEILDGLKTFNAKVKDNSGNIVYIDTVTKPVPAVHYDATKPTATIEADKEYASEVEEYNTVVLTINGSDEGTEPSGIVSWTLYRGETEIRSGSELPATITLSAATELLEGTNTFSVKVVDKAENENEVKPSVDVVKDTKAPEASLGTTLNSWYTAPFDFVVTYVETSGLARVRALSNMSATVAPAAFEEEGFTNIDLVASPLAISADKVKYAVGGKPVASAEPNYMHVQLIDIIGNTTYVTFPYNYDDVKPTIELSFTEAVYPSAEVKLNISTVDVESGIASIWFSADSDLTGVTKEAWIDLPVNTPAEFTVTDGDGIKTVRAKVKDVAGNESEGFVSASCEIDTTEPYASIVLTETDGRGKTNQVSTKQETVVTISVTDPQEGTPDAWGDFEFCFYGDIEAYIEGGETIANAEKYVSGKWYPLVNTAGKASMDITVVATAPTASDNRVTRSFSVQFRDNVGHISNVATAAFTLDMSAPQVDITELDHNRISKVHLDRNCNCTGINSHTAAGFADEVKFYIEPVANEVIAEYRVCAYESIEALRALAESEGFDISAQPTIGTAGGSVNMFGNPNHSNRIDCMIRGVDYEEALVARGLVAGDTAEGAHIVAVFVKNDAGIWSEVLYSI